MNKIRFRFAPSPTGFLHIGNLRTALFGYLLSRSLGGDFILRIEDTDQKREVEGAEEKLLEILSWIGIKFSEGPHLGGPHAPYIQTERLGLYQKYIQELLDKGEAYYCFCTSERLEKMREEQSAKKEAPRYDRACRQLDPKEVAERIARGEKYVIRQKMPLEGEVKVYDELRGEIIFQAQDLEDHVLIKSDGIPTYQFANIVDDHLMGISHVTRGEEWLPSYPKNILLYKSFGWEAPKYIHLPLILNKGGGKLSKRQGDVFVEDYKAKGYLREAIINFCALLGWHGKDDQEIFSLEELENKFNLSGLGTSPAVFDVEKLDFLNGHYIRQKSLEELMGLCWPYLLQAGYPLKENDKDFIIKVIKLCQERMVRLEDVVALSAPILKEKLEYESELLVWKQLSLKEIKNNLEEMELELNKISNWEDLKALEEGIISYLKTNDKKMGDYLWPLRVALSGEKNSPSPFELLWALGRENSLKRVKEAIDKI